MELNEGQKKAVQEAIKRINNHEICTCIAGPAGTGKAQPVNTKIPTPTGKMRIGDLKVGDFVFNEHGKPVKVVGVFPQGQKEIYEVKFRDGRKTECCSEHLWTVRIAGLKNMRTLTTQQILDNGLYHDGVPKFKIPLLDNPVEYEEKEEDKKTDYYTDGLNLAFSGKRIPDKYKTATTNARREFVKGLMDYYGSVREDEKNNTYRVKFSALNNYDLAVDMQEMLFSLGYISRINSNLVDFVGGEFSVKHYYLSIDIPNEEIHNLFRNSSYFNIALKAKDKETIKDYTTTSIIDIKATGKYAEMVCIKVDNPSELYLTNDFIVTHNTTVVRYIIDELGLHSNEVAFATFTGKAAQVLQKKGNRNAMTLHKLLYDWRYDKELREFYRIKKDELTPEGSEDEYKLIVVDEVSMAPKDLMDELFSHRIPVICLGDDA